MRYCVSARVGCYEWLAALALRDAVDLGILGRRQGGGLQYLRTGRKGRLTRYARCAGRRMGSAEDGGRVAAVLRERTDIKDGGDGMGER